MAARINTWYFEKIKITKNDFAEIFGIVWILQEFCPCYGYLELNYS